MFKIFKTLLVFVAMVISQKAFSQFAVTGSCGQDNGHLKIYAVNSSVVNSVKDFFRNQRNTNLSGFYSNFNYKLTSATEAVLTNGVAYNGQTAKYISGQTCDVYDVGFDIEMNLGVDLVKETQEFMLCHAQARVIVPGVIQYRDYMKVYTSDASLVCQPVQKRPYNQALPAADVF